MGDGERGDGELIYQEEDDETVDINLTNNSTGCTTSEIPGSDHLSTVETPLAQPSQIIASGISQTLTPRDTQE